MTTMTRTLWIVAAVGLSWGISAPAGAASYPIVDTSQEACYSDRGWMPCSRGGAFFGQDAQYDGLAPSYTDNGDGTVTDEVTGLMWQRDPGLKMTWGQALAALETFDLGGHDDWRLPTIKELYSLIQFSGIDPMLHARDTSSLVPFIDDDVFVFQYGDATGERIIDSQFLSSDVYAGEGFDALTVFGVNFADGRIKGYGSRPGRPKTFYVLYVRGNPEYGINAFIDHDDGTVTDAATGLTWQRDDSLETLDWSGALNYCEDLDAGGYDDWRLPSAKELQSIVDYSRAPSLTRSAAIDPLFDATEIVNEDGDTDWAFYWSSTTHVSQATSAGNAAYVSFGRGLGYMHGAWVDVHGAGSQRSDPKAGDPADHPRGLGPQGDARRIYNLARCVRGGVVFDGSRGEKTFTPTATAPPRRGAQPLHGGFPPPRR